MMTLMKSPMNHIEATQTDWGLENLFGLYEHKVHLTGWFFGGTELALLETSFNLCSIGAQEVHKECIATDLDGMKLLMEVKMH